MSPSLLNLLLYMCSIVCVSILIGDIFRMWLNHSNRRARISLTSQVKRSSVIFDFVVRGFDCDDRHHPDIWVLHFGHSLPCVSHPLEWSLWLPSILSLDVVSVSLFGGSLSLVFFWIFSHTHTHTHTHTPHTCVRSRHRRTPWSVRGLIFPYRSYHFVAAVLLQLPTSFPLWDVISWPFYQVLPVVNSAKHADYIFNFIIFVCHIMRMYTWGHVDLCRPFRFELSVAIFTCVFVTLLHLDHFFSLDFYFFTPSHMLWKSFLYFDHHVRVLSCAVREGCQSPCHDFCFTFHECGIACQRGRAPWCLELGHSLLRVRVHASCVRTSWSNVRMNSIVGDIFSPSMTSLPTLNTVDSIFWLFVPLTLLTPVATTYFSEIFPALVWSSSFGQNRIINIFVGQRIECRCIEWHTPYEWIYTTRPPNRKHPLTDPTSPTYTTTIGNTPPQTTIPMGTINTPPTYTRSP